MAFIVVLLNVDISNEKEVEYQQNVLTNTREQCLLFFREGRNFYLVMEKLSID